jgi:hypothetical protein
MVHKRNKEEKIESKHAHNDDTSITRDLTTNGPKESKQHSGIL